MPVKKKKSAKTSSAKSRKGSSRSRSRSPSAKKGRKSAKSAKSRLMSASFSEEQREPDIMDTAAMENLYFIAHDVPQALEIRGFQWESAPKKKGKKGKKKKK